MAQNNYTNHSDSRYSFPKKVWITGGIFALITILLLLFKTLFSAVLLVFAGVLIAIFFHGFAGLIRRKLRLSDTLSLLLSISISLLLIVAFFWFVGARLQQQVTQLSDTLPQTIQQAKDKMGQSTIGRKALDYLNSSGKSGKTHAVLKRFLSSGFGVVSDLYIVILLAVFFTAGPSLYKKGIIKLLPPKAKAQGTAVLNKIAGMLRKWLKGQIIGIVFIAILTAIALLILGMPLVLTLALLAGLLNFIPNFGPIIAMIPAVLIGLTQGTTTAIIIACIYTGIQIIQSAVEQPLVQKKMVNIPPALIIFGQVAMGALGGFWGVLLATPFMVILMVLVQELYVKKQESNG